MILLNILFNYRLLYGIGKYIFLKINVLSLSVCMIFFCSSMCVLISFNIYGMFIIYNYVYYMYILKKVKIILYIYIYRLFFVF